MDKIGPKEAASIIRAEYLNEHVDPRFHHQVRFAGDVLAELGEEKSIENTAKVMRLLTLHSIEGHAYADYPKWVTNDRGEKAVVNDEEHEAAFMARPESHVDDAPNPEHGHVDPQTGEFIEGIKSVDYDRPISIGMMVEPDLVETAPEPFVPQPDLNEIERQKEADRENAGAAAEVDQQQRIATDAATANSRAQAAAAAAHAAPKEAPSRGLPK